MIRAAFELGSIFWAARAFALAISDSPTVSDRFFEISYNLIADSTDRGRKDFSSSFFRLE